MVLTAIETILISLLMSVIYVILGVAKSVGEDFEPIKAGATIVLGLIIGTVMYISGIPITEANVTEQLAIYCGLLYVLENIIKTIVRRLA